MPNYQDFVKMARERHARSGARGNVVFTRHAEYKMRQYGLSAQRVRAVIRNPKRREEGIAKNTVAVMQPPSVKRKDGKETWNQEIWVMFQVVKSPARNASHSDAGGRKSKVESPVGKSEALKVISAWRYPGVSPKRNPVPDEILREIEEGSMLEEEGII